MTEKKIAASQFIALQSVKLFSEQGMIHLVKDTVADIPLEAIESLLVGGFIKEHFNNKKED